MGAWLGVLRQDSMVESRAWLHELGVLCSENVQALGYHAQLTREREAM